MKPDFDFSEEDSEKFIREFNDVTDGPMADVAAALRSLSHTPQLPPRAKPKVFPSQISIKPAHKLRFFGGGVVTGVATIGAAAGLALGAAAVTGNFPPVISDTAKKVAHVIGNVFTSDPVTPTSQDQLNEEVVHNIEEGVAPTVSEPAPQQSQATQQPVAPVEKKKDQSQLPAQNLPAAPKPSALAQPDVPAVSNQEDNDESEGKSNSGISEKSENTKSETEKSENSSLNPITATPSANEKKDAGEKKPENKSSESKDEKDD